MSKRPVHAQNVPCAFDKRTREAAKSASPLDGNAPCVDAACRGHYVLSRGQMRSGSMIVHVTHTRRLQSTGTLSALRLVLEFLFL